jgi:hypothetical protein
VGLLVGLFAIRQTNQQEKTMNKLSSIKQQIIHDANETRKTRDRMRVAKQQSRAARQAGDLDEADLLMREGVGLWRHANYDRDERRHQHLAYAYLKGRLYRECEQRCREDNLPNLNSVLTYARDYLAEGEGERLERWLREDGERRERPVEAPEVVPAPRPSLARRVVEIVAGA